MIVKSPTASGVTATSVVLSGVISVSTLSGFEKKPCTRSVLVRRRMTVSPFLSVISFGVNSNFFAVISITFGLTAALADSIALARWIFGVTAASAIAHMAPKSIAVTTLFLIIVAFILLVLAVSASVFEHLIHSDGARVLGRRELNFLDLQIATLGVAVNASDSQVLERLRLVEWRRLFLWRRFRIGECEDQRARRVKFGLADLMRVLAMNMAVEHGYVFVRSQRVHHVVAVAGEPFPFGLEVEQRTMREHDDRRGFRKPGQIGLHPGELLGSYLGPSGRDVVECDEVN